MKIFKENLYRVVVDFQPNSEFLINNGGVSFRCDECIAPFLVKAKNYAEAFEKIDENLRRKTIIFSFVGKLQKVNLKDFAMDMKVIELRKELQVLCDGQVVMGWAP